MPIRMGEGMNLAGVAEERVREQGERLSLFCEGREITNLEMQRASRKLARVLKDLAVKRGTG
jgi:hypothetical protein